MLTFPAPIRLILALICFSPVASVCHGDWKLDQMVDRDSAGQPIYRARPIDERFRNPISEADERAFQERARHVIASQAQRKISAGNTYFENEKRTYGYLMAQVLAGNERAVRDLQLEDAQSKEWHRETEGIDFYAAFTLKHQTRKFFYFGDLLEPDYRRRMLAGAKRWTSQDPLKRPHYAFDKPGEGWGPNVKNSWVDVRSTENLYLMRVTSVYLFAEAANSREVIRQYKDEIRRYVRALYQVGMGEWDSENYHGHSIGPLCNLYDFARDDEVRLLAKAALDWVFAAGAVKYYRGAFNGPTKRDYNHAQPFGGSAANMLWLHFGDTPQAKEEEWESDEVHLITSAYRPPPAIMNLARKRFDKPVELWASKPHYSATTSGDAETSPEYLETHYFGHSYQIGSLASGTSEDGGDVNGFKLLMHSSERGADAIQCVPGPDPAFVGSPQYQKGKVAAANRVAQYHNLAIWLVRDGRAPWCWVLPDAIEVSQRQGVTFLKGERTWIAITPLGIGEVRRDEALTRQIAEGEKAKFPRHQVLKAVGQTAGYCGWAMEVGEPQSHGNYDKFQNDVLAAEVDMTQLSEGIARYKSSDGKWLGFHWNDNANELGVWRNGERHDWNQHGQYLYLSQPTAEQPAAPIWSRWGEGTLYVEAGGEAFRSTVPTDGKADFVNGKPAEVRPTVTPE